MIDARGPANNAYSTSLHEHTSKLHGKGYSPT